MAVVGGNTVEIDPSPSGTGPGALVTSPGPTAAGDLTSRAAVEPPDREL